MGVTALLMAGGKGSRMDLEQEKPLLMICGKTMVEHVLSALKKAEKVDDIVVTVSKRTPMTAKMLKEYSIKVLETPGIDYVYDSKYAIKRLELDTVLTISADLPLVTSEVVNEVIKCYKQCRKPALTVVVPAEIRERLGLKVNYVFELNGKAVVPSGINVINGKRIDEHELEEETLIIEKDEIAVNVNTLKDFDIAKRLFKAFLKA